MKQKILKINEVKQLPKNSEFSVLGIVLRISTRRDRNDNIFWDLTIGDQSGELDGKAWGTSSWWNNQGGDRFMIDPDNCGFKVEGMSVGLIGKVGDFKDQLQYNFSEIYIIDQNKYPPINFKRRSPIAQEILEESFNKLIDEISNDELRDFMKKIFFERGLWESFKIWPAAVSMHHAYAGGLLEHSVSVAIGARDLAKHYEEFKMPVNMDLVIAGALLHDIGKLEAYAADPVAAVKPVGNVIEHIVLGYGMLMKFAELEGLDKNVALALSHIILSHHGRREFGSPVLPETPEAFIVSAADDVDFKISFWKAQMEALTPPTEITEYFPMIERRLWRGTSAK
ncbi:MAG: HD domain-containing protein [Synergistaceae bacterium]|nr:HD domain-containing protein [Synergistaceae bacterium]